MKDEARDMTYRMPKVTVLTAIYNAEFSVASSAQSILGQTFKDFEWIVIDDGSTDQSAEIIRNLRDERVVLKSVRHSGLAKALNQGLALARGKYIARMDADDVALAERLEKQVSYLDQHSLVAAVGTAYEVLTEDGVRKKPHVPLLTSSFQIKKALPKFNPFFHGSMMIRREALETAGFYNESFRYAQDYDLWFRIAHHHEITNLPEVLMLRREGKQTVQKEALQNYYAIRARLKAIRENNSTPWNVAYLFRPFLVMIIPIWLKSIIRRVLNAVAR